MIPETVYNKELSTSKFYQTHSTYKKEYGVSIVIKIRTISSVPIIFNNFYLFEAQAHLFVNAGQGYGSCIVYVDLQLLPPEFII